MDISFSYFAVNKHDFLSFSFLMSIALIEMKSATEKHKKQLMLKPVTCKICSCLAVYCMFLCVGGKTTCSDHEFMCISDQKCIHILLHCDGIEHCHDGSDELNCNSPGIL